jgi:hypothetical protein
MAIPKGITLNETVPDQQAPVLTGSAGASVVSDQLKAASKTKPPKLKPDAYTEGPDGRVPVYYSIKAQKIMRDKLGRSLTNKEKRVLSEEAYVDGRYYDVGEIASGVGQTGEFMDKGFVASLQEHEERVRRELPDYDLYPEYLQEEFLQSMYRGDILISPLAMDHFRAGRYDEASKEFLDHAEYKNKRTPKQIKARIKSVSDAMAKYGKSQEP